MREQYRDVMVQAKKRIEELEAAIHNCEQFDNSLTECQAWCNHVQLILSCRAANDVSALDVPHEYKVNISLTSFRTLIFFLTFIEFIKVSSKNHEKLGDLIFFTNKILKCIILKFVRGFLIYVL